MPNPKETFEEHNAVNHKGGKPHDDTEKQCQCAECKKHRAAGKKGNGDAA